jgi:hypothetical protein
MIIEVIDIYKDNKNFITSSITILNIIHGQVQEKQD